MGREPRYRNAELSEWVYAAESPIHGTGLFARRAIAAGEYIGTYWGPTARRNGRYVLWVCDDREGEESWEGRSGRNLLRYLNHSRDCNAEFDGYDLYALRDIAPDEEITFYYGDEFHDSL
jgi:SET domain-containing protein